MRKLATTAAAVAALTTLATLSGPAEAAPERGRRDDGRTVQVTDTLTTLDGRIVSTRTSTYRLDGLSTLRDTGSGGSSSGRGCRTVTLKNKKESSFLGSYLFTYTTKTSWCWKRGRVIPRSSIDMAYDVDTGVFVEWKGQVSSDNYYYDWKSGHSRSGWVHYRTGEFGNCPTFGCVESWFAKNKIRSHSDGTYNWETWD